MTWLWSTQVKIEVSYFQPYSLSDGIMVVAMSIVTLDIFRYCRGCILRSIWDFFCRNIPSLPAFSQGSKGEKPVPLLHQEQRSQSQSWLDPVQSYTAAVVADRPLTAHNCAENNSSKWQGEVRISFFSFLFFILTKNNTYHVCFVQDLWLEPLSLSPAPVKQIKGDIRGLNLFHLVMSLLLQN